VAQPVLHPNCTVKQVHQPHHNPTEKASQHTVAGHTPLAKHLHHIGKADSPICPACQQGKQTVQHFMLHCTAHQEARLRQGLCNSIGGRNINITKFTTTPNTLPALF
jgi:hypothetical protein